MVTKRLFTISLMFIIFLSVPMQQSSAHTILKASGATNGGVIHITPDDDPIISEPSVITLDLKDSSQLSSLNSSYIRIYKPDSSNESPRATLSGSTISAPYTFTSAGSYDVEIVLNGISNNGSATTSTFRHTVHVNRYKKTGLSINEVILFAACTFAFVGIGAMLQLRSKKTSNK